MCNEGSCRVCVVEVKGAAVSSPAARPFVSEGMEVFTSTPKVMQSRKTTIELIMSNHKKDCLSCVRSGNCELQQLSQDYGCDCTAYAGQQTAYKLDDTNPYLIRDNNKCILCRRCVAVCNKVQAVGVIGANKRGFSTQIAARSTRRCPRRRASPAASASTSAR